VVFFHGGGLVLGNYSDVESEKTARRLVKRLNLIVLSVDYRLTPENLVPEAIDDGVSAVLWVHQSNDPFIKQHVDSSKIILFGISAGGYLAATVSSYVHQTFPDARIIYQILVVPLLNEEETPSRKRLANTYILSLDFTAIFDACHSPKTPEFQNSSLYRLLNAKSFKGLPSTHVVVADRDLLQDEGRMYYDRLLQDGVQATLTVAKNSVHFFLGMGFLPESHRVWEEILDGLKRILNP